MGHFFFPPIFYNISVISIQKFWILLVSMSIIVMVITSPMLQAFYSEMVCELVKLFLSNVGSQKVTASKNVSFMRGLVITHGNWEGVCTFSHKISGACIPHYSKLHPCAVKRKTVISFFPNARKVSKPKSLNYSVNFIVLAVDHQTITKLYFFNKILSKFLFVLYLMHHMS